VPRSAETRDPTSTSARYRILVVDHRELLQLGFRSLLGPLAWVERCLAARSLEQASELAALMVDFGEVTTAEVKEAAAHGFIPKDWEGQRIVETIRRLTAGEQLPAAADEPRLGLSARQHEILVRVAAGATNPEIAAAHDLSRETVKDELSKIYRKLGVRNRVEAAAFAERIGIRH
jgi:DNA-binding NarL/FixJ family response regulator